MFDKEDLRSRIKRRLDYAGATPSFGQVRQLEDYFKLLTKWNRQLNLTSVDLDPPTDDAVDRILIEPAIAAARRVSAMDEYLVDIGSGSGSPAIPMKIVAPHLRLLMVESLTRKSAFLRDAVRQLGLKDVRVAQSRFEDLELTAGLEGADLVSIRAVRPDPAILQRITEILAPRGTVLWFTSSTATEDVTQATGEFLFADTALSLIPNTASRLVVFTRKPA